MRGARREREGWPRERVITAWGRGGESKKEKEGTYGSGCNGK